MVLAQVLPFKFMNLLALAVSEILGSFNFQIFTKKFSLWVQDFVIEKIRHLNRFARLQKRMKLPSLCSRDTRSAHSVNLFSLKWTSLVYSARLKKDNDFNLKLPFDSFWKIHIHALNKNVISRIFANSDAHNFKIRVRK